MKTLAYVVYHYGIEYLKYSIEAIHPFVDEILILYSDKPTFGQNSDIPNPDTEADLINIITEFDKITLQLCHPNGEGKHRTIAVDYGRAHGYDIVMAVDADEVWHPNTVRPAIEQAHRQKFSRYGVMHSGWYHFWRSFNEVNKDGFEPIRFHNLRVNNNDEGRVEGTVYHFGYANREKLQEYKMSIHGHKAEIKSDWFTKKWLNYQKGKTTHLHPASNDIWIETQPFDKTQLPDLLKKHPYYNLDKIV